jgi:hypothetical protein
MKRVSYAGGSFVTSDEVAEELLDFVVTVPRNRRNQVVTVPGFDTEGRASVVALVLGPSSQLMSLHEAVDYSEPDTTTVVEHLRAQARSPENTALLESTNRNANFDYDAF